MNKQKYIIGDIVWYENKFMIVKECRDNNRFDLFSPKEHLIYCYVGEDEIEPVKLSSVWLETNGWKKRTEFGEYWFIPRNEDYELLALDKIGEEWSIYIEENATNFEYIKYIHQLQHLLFGLGIKSEMEV